LHKKAEVNALISVATLQKKEFEIREYCNTMIVNTGICRFQRFSRIGTWTELHVCFSALKNLLVTVVARLFHCKEIMLLAGLHSKFY
jgi:hypothetical protein